MASGKGFQSKKTNEKVGQTLQDLEAAFADWEALSDIPVEPAVAVTASPSAQPKDAELREKTKKLLNQLREQLAELAD